MPGSQVLMCLERQPEEDEAVVDSGALVTGVVGDLPGVDQGAEARGRGHAE